VLYLFHVPRSPLDRYVERFWLVAGGEAPRQDRILPSGTLELVINLRDDRVRVDRTARFGRVREYSGIVVSGAYSEAFVVDAAQHAAMMGVHFRPGGAPTVLGVPAGELADAHVNLADLWGESAAGVLREKLCSAPTHEGRFRVLERALLDCLETGPLPHPAVQIALGLFGPDGEGATVREAVRRTGLSHRRLLTLFTAAVGLSPKAFCRILRFQHVHAIARRTGRIDWADLALRCGFHDQSHLANEFRRLCGLTPREYERALRDRHHLLSGHVAAQQP
jgi:AraC-like DNA-binding protein